MTATSARGRVRSGLIAVLVAAVAGSLSPVVAAPASGVPEVTTTVPGAPSPTPVTDHCPYRVHTPPAVDTSEVVAPGATTPTPLPVPDPPVGGQRLGGCGVVADPAAGPVPGRLTSSAWMVADLDSGRIIATKDPHGRYRPASTIKVLLALVVLDELDLNKTVEATPSDWSMEGDSCGMGPRGKYTNRQMLTGLLMVSGNDCANNFARQLGGIDATLAKMNAKAHSLGADDTRVASPSGLDAPGMSTSPYDLALFFRAGMANPTFRELIALRTFAFPGYPKRLDVPGDKDHPGYLMQTSNEMVIDGYPGALGGKTGYTDDAKKTFVGATERDGRRIMIVQMYGLTIDGDSYWDQADSLFRYGFAAPRDVSVGELTGSAAAASGGPSAGGPSPTADSTDTQAQRSTTTSGSGSPLSTRVLIGLGAGLLVVLLLLAALRFRRRS